MSVVCDFLFSSKIISQIVSLLRTFLWNSRLRTLEFWVDNLNAEFLFPIISRDSDLFSELMLALTDHLRPAPYQYGLLTLRLLGKLGGKNRLFLQQPMEIPTRNNKKWSNSNGLQINCKWNNSSKYSLDLPLERAVFVLKNLSLLQKRKKSTTDDKKNANINHNISTTFSEESKVEDIDLSAYKSILLRDITHDQGSAAFDVIRAALSALVAEDDALPNCRNQEVLDKKEKSDEKYEINNDKNKDLSFRLSMEQMGKDGHYDFLLCCKGLFHAASINFLSDDASLLVEGLMHQMVLLIANNIDDVSRVDDGLDANKNKSNTTHDSGMVSSRREPIVVSGKLQPLAPFGYFSFSGRLGNNSDYFILNEVLPDILKRKNQDEVKYGLLMIEKLVKFTNLIDRELPKTEIEKECNAERLCCTDIFLENLLHHLCESCLSYNWESRRGIFEGICKLLELAGANWSSKFEAELIHVAIFCLKDYPREISIAEKDALNFFFRVFSLLYGNISPDEHLERISDEVAVPHQFNKTDLTSSQKDREKIPLRLPKSEAICTILIAELGSPKCVLRYVDSILIVRNVCHHV